MGILGGSHIFFFKVTFHAVFLQLADGDQTVHGVPGKSADRLCDNEVDFSGKSVRNHAVKAVSLFGVTAGNALIRIYFYEVPFRLGLYEFGVNVCRQFYMPRFLWMPPVTAIWPIWRARRFTAVRMAPESYSMLR